MEAVPTLLALAAALVLTPRILRHLRENGFVRENWRGTALPFPAGIAIAAAAILTLGAIGALEQLADEDFYAGIGAAGIYLLGVAVLGLVDDCLAGVSRGWRGHAAALRAGGFSTGALKAVGSLALALYVLAAAGLPTGEYLLAVGLLVLTTNLFNLLDLRPGRSVKAFALLAGGLLLATWDLGVAKALAPFLVPVLVVGLWDLRERAMLGDTGANAIGALAGLWLVTELDTTGQLIALAVVLALTVYGEFRSLSALIERTPLVRQIDSLGRNGTHA